jgi:hypothetical protein
VLTSMLQNIKLLDAPYLIKRKSRVIKLIKFLLKTEGMLQNSVLNRSFRLNSYRMGWHELRALKQQVI